MLAYELLLNLSINFTAISLSRFTLPWMSVERTVNAED